MDLISLELEPFVFSWLAQTKNSIQRLYIILLIWQNTIFLIDCFKLLHFILHGNKIRQRHKASRVWFSLVFDGGRGGLYV